MKKSLAFILAVMVFTAVGCKPKSDEKTVDIDEKEESSSLVSDVDIDEKEEQSLLVNNVDISDFEKISLSEEIVISPLDELPVKFSKIKMPVFETHDIIGIDFDNYQGQVPEEVPPKTSDGYVADYFVCDGYAYYVVTYDQFFYGGNLSQDICIYEQNLETENVDIIYTYQNTETLLRINNVIKIDHLFYWTEFYLDKTEINVDSDSRSASIICYNPENDNKTVLYSTNARTWREAPALYLSAKGIQWSEESVKSEEIDPETKELLKRESSLTTYEYNAKTNDINQLEYIENFSMREYIKEYDYLDYIGAFYKTPVYPNTTHTVPYYTDEHLVEIVHKSPLEHTIVKTDYRCIKYLSQTEDTFSYVDWPSEYGQTYPYYNPIITILNFKDKTIKTFNVAKIGNVSSPMMTNQIIFLYYTIDNLVNEGPEGFPSLYKNVYLLDTESGNIFNLTNNAGEDHFAFVDLSYLNFEQNGDYIYFYTMRKDKSQTPDRYYDYLYYIKV